MAPKHRTHSPACTCGARHWRIETLPDNDAWVGHCADCGAERRWPTHPEQGHPLRKYTAPTAHAPAAGSYIAIKPATVERTW